ncbi:MAG TPA: oligosaccharide flippase family protein [Thermoguttaceae bacterium]|nr:oligosaccharide flippase family protein [Thermoguttaceae bacterium]
MDTKRLAIRSVAFNWLGRGCSFIITFIVTPIIIHGLGNEAYGIWAIVMSAASYYAIADLGLQSACVKYIAQFVAVGDRGARDNLVLTAFCLYSLLAVGVLLISLPVTWVFPYLFDFAEQKVTAVRWAVFLTGATVAVRLQGQVFVAAIKAHNRFDVANAISVISQIVDACLTVWVVWSGKGLIGMACVMVGVTTLNRLAEAYFALRLMPGLKLRYTRFERESFRLLFHFSSMNVISNIANRVNRKSAPLIIGFFLGPAMVPFFEIANRLIAKAKSLTMGVNSVALPVASQLDAENRREHLVQLLILVPRSLVAVSMTIGVVLIAMGDRFIELWIGPEYVAAAYPVLCVLTAAFVISMISGGVRATLAGTGRIRYLAKINTLAAVISVALQLVLIQLWGLIGVAWAVLVTSVVVDGFVLPMVACRTYKYPLARYLPQTFLRPVVAMLPAAALAWFLVTFLPPSRMLELLAEMAITGSAAAIAAFFVCLDSSLRACIIRAVWPVPST